MQTQWNILQPDPQLVVTIKNHLNCHPIIAKVLANGDGIVPRECAIWPHENIASARRDLLEVGTPEIPIAHADMFVSDHAPEMVFEPLANWLEAR